MSAAVEERLLFSALWNQDLIKFDSSRYGSLAVSLFSYSTDVSMHLITLM